MTPEEQHRAWSDLVYNWPAAPKYKGITCQQHQSDLNRYAEVIRELQPPWLLQTGVFWGGTSLFLADVMAEHGGRAMFVDINLGPCMISEEDMEIGTLAQASATAPGFFEKFRDFADGGRGLISLDDDHTAQQVYTELLMYSPYADYLVVEDTILDLAVGTHYQPSNPKMALDSWMERDPIARQFSVDPDPEPTQHMGGWLRRISG